MVSGVVSVVLVSVVSSAVLVISVVVVSVVLVVSGVMSSAVTVVSGVVVSVAIVVVVVEVGVVSVVVVNPVGLNDDEMTSATQHQQHTFLDILYAILCNFMRVFSEFRKMAVRDNDIKKYKKYFRL